MSEELTIGQMAKLNCVSEKTLRIYHRKGILSPARIDETNGYRYYTLDQCVVVDVVQQMQSLGFSLDEIAEILQSGDHNAYEQAVEARLAEIEAQMAQLQRHKRLGEKYLRAFDSFRSMPAVAMIIEEHLPEKAILRFGVANDRLRDPNLTGRELITEWERQLRAVKQQIVERGLPTSLFYHVGCTFDCTGYPDRPLTIDDTFVFVNKTFGDLFDKAEHLPAGDYLCVYYDSLICPDDGMYSTPKNVARILDFAREKGIVLDGECFGVDIAEPRDVVRSVRDMSYKVCIRILENRAE